MGALGIPLAPAEADALPKLGLCGLDGHYLTGFLDEVGRTVHGCLAVSAGARMG
jgi:hypothetical protein